MEYIQRGMVTLLMSQLLACCQICESALMSKVSSDREDDDELGALLALVRRWKSVVLVGAARMHDGARAAKKTITGEKCIVKLNVVCERWMVEEERTPSWISNLKLTPMSDCLQGPQEKLNEKKTPKQASSEHAGLSSVNGERCGVEVEWIDSRASKQECLARSSPFPYMQCGGCSPDPPVQRESSGL